MNKMTKKAVERFNKDLYARLKDMTSNRSGVVAIALLFIVGFGWVGLRIQSGLHAATATASIEAESGTNTGVTTVTDPTASGGAAIKFGMGIPPSTGNPAAGAGAILPINYSLSTLTGTVYYVSPFGSDAGTGTVASPFATMDKAITTAAAGSTIVLRGGTYRQSNIALSKTLKVIAYPGETPVFSGSAQAASGWTASGTASYHAYTPIPVTDGNGISFSTCQNQVASCVGKFPDQAWVGSTQLRQVASQSAVVAGSFYVDRTNNRIYLASTDVSKGSVEFSNLRTFMTITAPKVTLSGIKIIRYSNGAGDGAVLKMSGTADNTLIEDTLISDAAFVSAAVYPNGTDLNLNSVVRDSTISFSNWMGISALATTSFTLDHVKINNMNQFGEFTNSPQSGALKTSRTWYTKVLNSLIVNNNSQGLWFDQSNYKTEIANNDIEDNNGSALFYEISDYGYIVNNYIKSTGGNRALKLAASSDLYMVNNTVIGGADPVGVYVDSRSIPGCSNPNRTISCGSYSSDLDTYHSPHPATMTWMPGINLFVNNIFAYPTATGYCGTTTALCVTKTNSTATVDITTIIHHANPTYGVPQSLMDGNVYANGAGNIVNLNAMSRYTTTGAFGTAIAGSPTSIPGFETHGLYGNSYVAADGTPTSTLSAKHSSAYAVPTDLIINQYIPAGHKHYGVDWK